MNDVLLTVSKRERRKLLEAEGSRRKRGDWGAWEKLTFPRGTVGSTWAAEFEEAYRNKVFSVLIRDVGSATHFAVSSLSGIRPTWREMQRIKDELAGPEKTAVEVYPPRSKVIDEADMFHIWVLPDGVPFGLFPTTSSGGC